MKKILNDRRGMAFESAILFLIIIFSFCMLVTSMSVVGKYQMKIEKTTILNKVRLDQIGEYFFAGKLQEGIVGDNEFYVKKKESESTNPITLQVWYGSEESGEQDFTAKLEEKEKDNTTILQVWYGSEERRNADLTVVLEKHPQEAIPYVIVKQWYYADNN